MSIYSKELVDYLNDKSNWPDGPWKDEPDELRWVDELTGYECYIRRNNMVGGILLGYVVLPEGHPHYDKDLGRIGDFIDVHGGITCHTKFTFLQDDKMYVGFDCGHAWDAAPFEWFSLINNFYKGKNMPQFPNIPYLFDECAYKDINFVKSECAHLAKQLKVLEQNQKTETPAENDCKN